MKNLLKIGILILLLSNTIEVKAQSSIPYKLHPTTNKISSLNTIIRFNKTATYDVDFKETSKYTDVNFKVSITLNENGTGKMVMAFDDSEKNVAVIESAYELIYSDSSEKYWKFQCVVDNSFHKDYIIDFKNNSRRLWFEADNNTRTYFLLVN